ncbi:30S ribosomal protein S20 [Lactobacillus amylolyticus DSM 11664]|nr:30S ribosomal protein S20 [Lactobacillus amylolyticus DSM 11664]
MNLMPQIKSAIKRVKTQNAANKRNAAQLNKLRTAVKKFKAAAEAGEEDASKLRIEAEKALDKAVSKGLIHKNKASRDKSRLSKLAK